MQCIFCQIRDRKIPKKFLYEDADVMVFEDIHPSKPVHILVVPKKHIEDFLDMDDDQLWIKLRRIAQKMIQEHRIADKGYRIGINGGGRQDINHVHIHIMGPMGTKTAL